MSDADDWFEKTLEEKTAAFKAAHPSWTYEKYEPRKATAAFLDSVAAFEAVAKGAPMLGTHPGYAAAGVPPTVGVGNRGHEISARFGVAAKGFTPQEALDSVLRSIQNEPVDKRRAAAAAWLTLLTRGISEFVEGLDESDE